MSTLNHFPNMSSRMPSNISPAGPKLTARQQQIFELIQRAIASTGAPPTRAEIATELGFKSANAAEEHLQALARKGVIELVSGTSRGIRLRAGDMRSVNESRLHQFSLPLQSLAQLVLHWWDGLLLAAPFSRRSTLSKATLLVPTCLKSSPTTC